MSKYKDQECLKARTIHIKGVLPQDRTGEGIDNYLNSILKQKAYGSQTPGKVISVLILPDFTKQLELEAKIQELKDSKMLMSVETPFCSCCLPNKYKDQAVFELEMERLEN